MRIGGLFTVSILVAFCLSSGIQDLNKLMNKSDDPMSPKEFNFMLMLGNVDTKKFTPKGFSVAKLTGSKLHQSDIVATAVEHHKQNGGGFKELYIMAHNQQTKHHFKPFNLDFDHVDETDRPFRFAKTGMNHIFLKHRSLESCIKSTETGVEFSTGNDKSTIDVKFGDKVINLPKKQLYSDGLVDFFMDVCKLVELSKLQRRDGKRNLVVAEIKNLNKLLNGKFSTEVKSVVSNVMTKVRENLSKVYGEENISMIGVHYKEALNTILKNSQRIMEETAVEVKAKDTSDRAGRSIVYNFSIFLFFVYLFVCVELYRMEVYKDSLVYSSFITSRKAD